MPKHKYEDEIKHLIAEDLSEYSENEKLSNLIKEQDDKDSIQNWFEESDIEETSTSLLVTETEDDKKSGIVHVNDSALKAKLAEEYSTVSNLNDDFEVIRRNMIDLSNTGALMLNDLMNLARATEHPNAFKIVTDTLVSLAQINKDLIDIYDKKISIETKIKKIEEAKEPQVVQQTNIQNNYVATTDEVYRSIIEKRKAKDGT